MTKKRRTTAFKLTIRASLERFNLPENFIQFVLSGLDQATSCFKTFYGLTEDFKVETSVRQGDPSPLIYILVVDALHEGWRDNPLYSRRTGTVSRTTKHSGFPPQDTRMTR